MRSLAHGCPIRSSLANVARGFNGKLIRTREKTFEEMVWGRDKSSWSRAPFTGHYLAVSWHRKVILYVDADWEEIIHEMGHVFACKQAPQEFPSEWDFLGWEVALATRFNLEAWITANHDYMLGDHIGLMRDVPRKELDVYLAERVRIAKEDKLVTQDGRPRSIRGSA